MWLLGTHLTEHQSWKEVRERGAQPLDAANEVSQSRLVTSPDAHQAPHPTRDSRHMCGSGFLLPLSAASHTGLEHGTGDPVSDGTR